MAAVSMTILLLVLDYSKGYDSDTCDRVDEKIIEVQSQIESIAQRQSSYFEEIRSHVNGMSDDFQFAAHKYAINRFRGTKGPCQNYVVLNDLSRNVNQPGGGNCDRTELMSDVWYRLLPPAGNQIPETAPPIRSCGTQAPMWLNGSHPTFESSGIVERQLCANGDNNTCKWTTTVQIILCSAGFYIYQAPLAAAHDCPSRWCAVSLYPPHPRPESFITANVSYYLPTGSYAVGITDDGRILVTSLRNGLFEFSSLGTMVSRWKAPMTDDMSSVAVLRDGRVVVSVSKSIVVLKRSSGSQTTGIHWLEERRISTEQSFTECLSVHDDVVVIIEKRHDPTASTTTYPTELELINITSAERLIILNRNYPIRSVVLTNQVIITMSYSAVSFSNGYKMHVVDAHTRQGDKRLWRYQIAEKDGIPMTMCADSFGRFLYVAVRIQTEGKTRLTAISLADGSELRRFALTYDDRGFYWPFRMAMARAGTKSIIAMLFFYGEQRFVAINPSDDDW